MENKTKILTLIERMKDHVAHVFGEYKIHVVRDTAVISFSSNGRNAIRDKVRTASVDRQRFKMSRKSNGNVLTVTIFGGDENLKNSLSLKTSTTARYAARAYLPSEETWSAAAAAAAAVDSVRASLESAELWTVYTRSACSVLGRSTTIDGDGLVEITS